MRHRMGFNKLSRNVSHRQALYRSMATALFKYERIKTTKPKAKEIRRVAEKMISRARTDSVHNRRIIGKRIKDKAVLAKLFTDIGPRFESRPGGYTRILKLGPRYGDASEMVLLELVERTEAAPRRRHRKEAAKAEAGQSAQAADSSAEGKSDAPAAKSGAPAAKSAAKKAAPKKPAAKKAGAAAAKAGAPAAKSAAKKAAAEKPAPAKSAAKKPAAAKTTAQAGAEQTVETPPEQPQAAESSSPEAGAAETGVSEES
ncbi:MAG: 50S ribosomal protein L17 [Spirochaetales bacterium]|nr:50S ribosomal protein L17 [Spirochaetales bacterium]